MPSHYHTAQCNSKEQGYTRDILNDFLEQTWGLRFSPKGPRFAHRVCIGGCPQAQHLT